MYNVLPINRRIFSLQWIDIRYVEYVCVREEKRREENRREENRREEKRGLPDWIERCFELVSVFSSFVPPFRGVQGAGGLSLSLFLSLSLLRVS